MSVDTSSSKKETISGLIFEFIRTHKSMLILYICFLLIIPIKDIGIPHLFGKLIKSIEDKSSLIKPVIYLFTASVAIHLSYSLFDYLEVELNPEFQAYVRQKVIKHIIDENNTNFDELESGKIISRLMRLPRSLYGYMNEWRYTFIPNIILSVVAVAYFTYYSKVLGILLLLLITFSWLMIWISVRKCLKYSYPSEVAVMYMYEQVDDVLKNMATVMNSNQQEDELRLLQQYEDEFKEYVKKTLVCSMQMRFMIVPFNILYFAIFLYICYNRVKDKSMRVSTFVALVIVVFKIFNTIWNISGVMNDATTRWGILKQSMEIFNTKQDSSNNSNITKSIGSDKTNGFYFDNISYSYKPNTSNEKTILKNFTLHIPKKSTFIIEGEIGTGKSTILKLIMKQIIPQSGTLYFQGIPYSLLDTNDIRKNIGYIQQNPLLFNRTVIDNIRYGLDGITEQRINDLIESLNLKEMFDTFPKGLDTIVGKYGSGMSGGQKQIIVLLRVLLQDPPVLLMDEPTSSIDEKTKDTIYNLIKEVIKNKTVIIVTHDKYLLRFASHTLQL